MDEFFDIGIMGVESLCVVDQNSANNTAKKVKEKSKGQKAQKAAKLKKELIMSLENQSEGDLYKEQASNNDAVPKVCGDTAATTKPKRKVIHFSDGSTMEDYDDDEDVTEKNSDGTSNTTDSVEGTIRSVKSPTSNSEPPLDPTKMNWPEWVRHYGSRAGSKTLTVLEGMGGTAAYYLGITTPKYQSEIDEYNRMVAKKKSHEEELVSWSTGPKTEQKEPVVNEVRKNENGDIEMTEK